MPIIDHSTQRLMATGDLTRERPLVTKEHGAASLTIREVALRWGVSIGKPQFVGTPEQVADKMEETWRETGCYGYNLTPSIMPSSVEDFVDQVVPILQKRGIYRTEYEGTTFRENLGLDAL